MYISCCYFYSKNEFLSITCCMCFIGKLPLMFSLYKHPAFRICCRNCPFCCPAAGEAHTATAVGSVIEIESDGVTGAWEYANSDISGNPVSLSLVLDGEAIYTAQLAPGESLDGIELAAPLAPGSYQAMAVATVYDADGEQQLTNRVPVVLNVAEN